MHAAVVRGGGTRQRTAQELFEARQLVVRHGLVDVRGDGFPELVQGNIPLISRFTLFL